MSVTEIVPNVSERHVSRAASVPFDAAKQADALTEAFTLIGAAVRFDRNTEIFGEAEPAEYFYQVVSGAVRMYKLLGRKNAEERVASFLLQMADRAAAERTLDLPMSRQDIADYLGLTIETVSRTLTQLEGKAAIELPSSRRVRLCNRAALQRLNA